MHDFHSAPVSDLEIGTTSAGDENEMMKNLESLLSEALAPDKLISPDLKVDDRDLPQFPNFYDFCMHPDGLDQAPLAKQLAFFTHLFGEWCPPCSSEIFHDIRDFPVDYPVKEAREHVTFLHYGVCPKCKRRKSEMILDGTLKDPIQLILIAGQRSGKSIGVSLAHSYIAHRFLKLQQPTKVYGQTRNTHFTMTMVGLTFGRAKDLLFTPFHDAVMTSPWYCAYHELLSYYGEKYGEEIATVGKEMINYRHRQLLIHPMNPNKRLLRGDTRCSAAVDELGWFPFGEESDERERAGADEVFQSLDRSLSTIRLKYDQLIKKGYDNIPNAVGLYISSPQAYNDKIMSLYRSHEGSDDAVVGQFPSWEMNPDFTRNNRVVKIAYRDNPIKAERDFGANPPLSDTPFIGDVTEFLSCFKKKKNLLANYKYKLNRKGSSTRRYAEFTRLPSFRRPTIMAIDAGINNNSFAICVGFVDDNERPMIIGMMEIAPSHGKSLDFALIYKEVILPIIKEMNVVRVYIDRWNSAKILHDVENDTGGVNSADKVEGVQYSIKKADFDEILEYMSDAEYAPHFPKLDVDYEATMNMDASKYPHSFKYQPISHLLFQMATVRETSRSVDKGMGYTDDIFRALMLLLCHLYDDDVVEWLKTKGNRNIVAPSQRALFAGGSLSGGGSNSGSLVAQGNTNAMVAGTLGGYTSKK